MADETSPGTLPGAIPDPLREEAQKIFVPNGLASASPSIEQFSCPECGRKFPKQQSLTMHRTRSHGFRNSNKRARKPKKRPVLAVPALTVPALTRLAAPAPHAQGSKTAGSYTEALELFLPALADEILRRVPASDERMDL